MTPTTDPLGCLTTLPSDMQSRLCRRLHVEGRRTVLEIAFALLAEAQVNGRRFSDQFTEVLKARIERARDLEEEALLRGLLHVVSANLDDAEELRQWIVKLQTQARTHAAILAVERLTTA